MPHTPYNTSDIKVIHNPASFLPARLLLSVCLVCLSAALHIFQCASHVLLRLYEELNHNVAREVAKAAIHQAVWYVADDCDGSTCAFNG